jgi:hypothetical protein
MYQAVLRIRDVYTGDPGSGFFPSRIPDPGSKIQDLGSGSAQENLSILTQKIVSKLSEI